MRTMIDEWLSPFLVLALTVAAAGCDSDEASGESSGGGEAEESGPLRTEDGYEVVFANPRGRTGPRSSKAGERTAQRRRDHLVLEPNSPDPEGGEFTLEEAVADMPIDGDLVAEIGTDLGTLFCDLHADKVPTTVANFIGLARGIRPWWDPAAGDWVRRPYYRGTTFHRVIPDYLIQAGDRVGDGTGGVGYSLPIETHETLRFDEAGILAMAGTEQEPNAGQFFITDGPAPQLQGRYTIFGECRPVDVVHRIARVPQSGRPDYRPLTDVQITRLFIRRVEGGAANARVTPPQPPPGFEPGQVDRGASPGPTEIQTEVERRRQLRQQGGQGH